MTSKRVAVEAARQVVADDRPRIAAVVAAKDLVGGEVEPGVRVGTDEERGVPVPAVLGLALARLGLDGRRLAARAVEAGQIAVLGLGVDDVRVFRIDGRLEAVPGVGRDPVGVDDAVGARRPGRAAQAVVVLGPAVDVVERRVVVGRDLVELGHRQVGHVLPGPAAVERLVDAAVVAVEAVIGVGGIDPEGVRVPVLALVAEGLPGRAAVVADLEEDVHGVDALRVLGIADELLVVVAARSVGAPPLPGGPAVRAAVEAAAVLLGFDDGVEEVRDDGRDGQADAAEVAAGQARDHLLPGLPGVRGLVDGRAGPAADLGEDVAAALMGRGVEDVGIARVEVDLADAGVLVDGEHGRPGLAAVGRLVEAAVAARAPQRAVGRDVDGVRRPRVDGDHADVLGGLEAHVLPGGAAVHGLVDAVAVADAALVVVLAGPDPDDVRVRGIEDDATDGVGALGVEDRSEGRPGVRRLPDAARGGGDEERGLVTRIDGEVRDAARGQGRADRPELEGAEGEVGVGIGVLRGGRFGLGLRVEGRGRDGRGQDERGRATR